MSLFTQLRRLIGALPDIAWFTRMGTQILGPAMTGHDVATDAHAAVKGLSGILGFKDERQMLVLLEKLERRVPGAARVVLEFLENHFSLTVPGLSFAAKRYIAMQKNRFRNVIVDMGETDGEKIGKTTVDITADIAGGGKISSKTERDLHGDAKDNGVDLLERMYIILTRPGGPAECVRFLKGANVPTVDPIMVGRLNAAHGHVVAKAHEVNAGIERAADRLHDHNTRRRREQSWIDRFLNSIK